MLHHSYSIRLRIDVSSLDHVFSRPIHKTTHYRTIIPSDPYTRQLETSIELARKKQIQRNSVSELHAKLLAANMEPSEQIRSPWPFALSCDEGIEPLGQLKVTL